MNTTRRALLAAGVAGTLTVAGCAGDGDDGANGGTTDSPQATTTGPTTAGTTTPGATVQVGTHPEYGEILVGPDGMTLYMFDSDTQNAGESTCYDGCAPNWPPLTVDETPAAGPDVSAELETFERDGGESQVSAAGWPLYYWASDAEPGDATGQGVSDVWWVLRPDGTPVRGSGSSADGSTAATATGTTVDSGDGYGY